MAALSAGLFGQTAGSGSISGTTTDASGSVVPQTTIVIHNSDTGSDRSVTTNNAGVYSATFLQPGHYDLTASKPGFAKVARTGLTIEVGRTVTIDFQLQVQSGQQTVTITGEAPVVDADKTEVSNEVSDNMIRNLPIIGRRWDNFVLLTPGVTTDGGLVSYRGISGLYNSNTVDGANNNQGFFSEAKGRSTVPYVYSLDSLQEFQVSSSNYSAEFGQAAGGVVNAVTKSGTNAMHGDVFYYLRYPALNALDSFNKSRGVYTQPVHQQQQFGGSVGGPIIKDKLFYFLTYDGSRKVFPITYTSSSNFPLPCPAQVSAAQCSAANGFFSSLVSAYPRTAVQDLAFGKLDYRFNSSNHVNASFDWDNYHAPNAYSSATSANNSSITTNGTNVTHERIFVSNWDSIIRNNIVNNFRFQWSQDLEESVSNSGGPSVSITNVSTYGMPNALPRPAFPNEHRLQFADTLSMTYGKHTIKTGVDVNRIHELLINLFNGGGVYSYGGSTSAAFNNYVLDTFGVNAGDGLTGRHFTSFTQATDAITGIGKDDFYDTDFAGFVEDTWKIAPRLTLNLGARYDLQHVPQPEKPNLSTPLTTLYTSTIKIDKNNFAPRLGAAWEPMKGLVARAGYGIFYGKTTNSTFYTTRVENGVFQQTIGCTPVSCPALTFPNLLYTPPGPKPAAPFAGALAPQVTPFTVPLGTQITRGQTPDFINPLVHEGDATIEKQLPGNQSISAAYLFSRGLHLPIFVDANLAPATTTHTYAVLNASNALVQTTTVPFYTQRLNPTTGVVLTGYSVLNSWYHGLVLTYRKPMSHGFEALIHYTVSKSIDDGAVAGAFGTFNGTDAPLDPQNQKQENSLSDLDQRQRFVSSIVYAPQAFHTLPNKVMRSIFDGFYFSNIVTISTGQPVFTSISSFTPAGGIDGGVTGGEVSNSGTPTGGRPPQYGRNLFAGPGLKNVDLRVMREFVVLEKYRLQMIAEAFNLFNHTNISSVNGTGFSYSAVGSGVCTAALAAGTNGCLVPSSSFFAPTSSSSTNGLYGARQMQFSAKITF